MVRGEPAVGCLEGAAAAQFPELSFGKLGAERGRRVAGTRRPPLEEFRSMILAGDIGGTNARLALFDVKNGKFDLVSSTVFPSRHYSGLDEIVKEFVKGSGTHPAQACFGIAGPVTNGRVEASNLPWVIESTRLADELQIDKALLINDLEATGWGVGALPPEHLVSLNQVSISP